MEVTSPTAVLRNSWLCYVLRAKLNYEIDFTITISYNNSKDSRVTASRMRAAYLQRQAKPVSHLRC